MQDNNREMPKVDAELYYVIDEKNNQVELSDKGVEYLSGKDTKILLCDARNGNRNCKD